MAVCFSSKKTYKLLGIGCKDNRSPKQSDSVGIRMQQFPTRGKSFFNISWASQMVLGSVIFCVDMFPKREECHKTSGSIGEFK